jgi:hypothetical protein
MGDTLVFVTGFSITAMAQLGRFRADNRIMYSIISADRAAEWDL